MNPRFQYQDPAEAILAAGPRDSTSSLEKEISAAGAYRVYRTCSLREAVFLLCQVRITLILCEWSLPDGDWKDILGYLAPLPDAPPVVVTTASESRRLRAEVTLMGGLDLLVRPYGSADIARLLAAAGSHTGRTQTAAR